jgi:signal transduction histidine kinase
MPELVAHRESWRAAMLAGIRPITVVLSAAALVAILFLMNHERVVLPSLGFAFLFLASIVPGVRASYRVWMIGLGVPVMCILSIPKFGLAPNIFGGLVLSVIYAKLLFGRRSSFWVAAAILAGVILMCVCVVTRSIEVSSSWKQTLDPNLPENVFRIVVFFAIEFVAVALCLGLFIRGLERLLWDKVEALDSLRDETAHKERLQAELRAHERADAKLRELEQLGRVASYFGHDTNNALQVACSSMAILREESSTAVEEHEALDALEDAVKQIRTTSAQLLAFGPGRRRGQGPTPLRKTVERATHMLRHVLAGEIVIELHVDDDAELLIDESEMHRILVNLALNARDAMHGKGVLTISAWRPQHDEQVGSVDAAGHIAIAVADTGSGIAPGDLDKIFEPFFTTKGNQGSGLGLASVREIVEACGGSIRVESAVGLGTKFILFLPARDDHPHSRAPAG